MTEIATEALFYHLERRTLEQVLPNLLERTLQRGWRAVVQAGSSERLEALDTALWTYSDDSFLPHGTSRDGHAELQPVYLTTEQDNPNAATVRFLVDGADIDDIGGYHRVVYLFDGLDPDAVARARQAWRRVKSAGAMPTYWQETAAGGWERKG
ncbi:MAG: DNA polymerase III subunit chi [Hyphomicrobiaceae bacterium]